MGLPSMTYFFKLADAGRKAIQGTDKTAAILYIDLNGMKYFNLKYGFAEGDHLIIALAQILVKFFGDECCSRFGQDHFAVYTVAEGLEDLLSQMFRECESINYGRVLPLKVGIYLDSMGDIETSLACDRAKYACNKKRQEHRSCFTYFSEEMLTMERNRQYILDNLDRALAEGWIKTFYQPIVRAANDRVSRCNKGYRDFLRENFGKTEMGAKSEHVLSSRGFGIAFMNAVRQCKKDGNRAFFDEYTEDGTKIHAFVRRVAVNPVTEVAACAVVVLAITDNND